MKLSPNIRGQVYFHCLQRTAWENLRSLYAPVWAHTVNGAWTGFFLLVSFKAFDTTMALITESIWKASLVWLVLIIAFFISRKRADMIPLMVTVAALAFLSGANSAMLLGMLVGWLLVGVGFGATIGMAVGNIVGYGRSAGIEKAPNASQESRRPLFERGIVLPLGVAIASGILYALALPPLKQFLESR